jgi:hypothetical protein
MNCLLRHQHFDLIFLQHDPLFGLPIDIEQEGLEHVPTMPQIQEFDANVNPDESDKRRRH